MSFNKVRGTQLQPGIITSEHIAVDTKFAEKHLNIDWDTHGNEILSKKLVVDFVQVEGVPVGSGADRITVTQSISAPAASESSVKGAIVEAGKNKVILRNALTGEPIISSTGTEVYGKLTHDGTDFFVTFFAKGDDGLEKAHSFADSADIDFQFPQRFDLLTISEAFAANEKFVDGAADVSARLDLIQLAKDLFGASYVYDHNGNANRDKTLLAELIDETSGATNTTVRAKAIIDEVVAARGDKASVAARFKAVEDSTSTRFDAVEKEVDELTEVVEAIHKHYAEDYETVIDDGISQTDTYTLKGEAFVAGDKSLQFFYNGMLQAVGLHYTEAADGTSITLKAGVFVEGDVIQLRYVK